MASKAVGASYAVLLSVDRLRILLEISQPICLLFDDIGIFLLLTSVQMVCPCEHARMRSVCTHVAHKNIRVNFQVIDTDISTCLSFDWRRVTRMKAVL